jgi:cell wall-associated NlpC family hydrolase
VSPDPRLNAYRGDLADERLRGIVAAARYVAGQEARVIAGIAAMRGRPHPQAEIATFCHYGERVLTFGETVDGHFWCQSLYDGYVGYVEGSCIAQGATPAPTHFVATLGSYRYEAPDLRSAVIDLLPRHSAVIAAETGLMTRGTEYARLDGGGFVPLACVAPRPPRSADLTAAAALYLGCPYLWGGRSFLGIDCSGLVQSALSDLGRTVPRDTDMQRDAIGVALTIDEAGGLRRDDLLYMPGHVLIYAGEGAVIHADGASMMVRRDPLAEFMHARGLGLADFVVRRAAP